MIELLSAAVVFWRFRFQLNEARAARIAGVFLFALAGLVMLTSVLNFLGYREAQRSLVGIGILLAAAVAMPWLASQKRQSAAITSSAALKADAAQSSLCAYMAWIALAGLSINVIWHRSWADPVAALALVPLIVMGSCALFAAWMPVPFDLINRAQSCFWTESSHGPPGKYRLTPYRSPGFRLREWVRK